MFDSRRVILHVFALLKDDTVLVFPYIFIVFLLQNVILLRWTILWMNAYVLKLVFFMKFFDFTCFCFTVEDVPCDSELQLIQQEVRLGNTSLDSTNSLNTSPVLLFEFVILQEVFFESVQRIELPFVSIDSWIFELQFWIIC